MFDRCFRCDQPGHTRANCPKDKKQPATAPASPAAVTRWINPGPPQNPHVYPQDHYLLYECPWCGAPVYSRCINVGTGRRLEKPHLSRTAHGIVDAWGVVPPAQAG
jgi:hypothetical protein